MIGAYDLREERPFIVWYLLLEFIRSQSENRFVRSSLKTSQEYWGPSRDPGKRKCEDTISIEQNISWILLLIKTPCICRIFIKYMKIWVLYYIAIKSTVQISNMPHIFLYIFFKILFPTLLKELEFLIDIIYPL